MTHKVEKTKYIEPDSIKAPKIFYDATNERPHFLCADLGTPCVERFVCLARRVAFARCRVAYRGESQHLERVDIPGKIIDVLWDRRRRICRLWWRSTGS